MTPADPPAAWIGGKRHLAKRVCAILAATMHEAYVEPFVGMGGVFLRRHRRPPVEVMNDISGDVVNLFRVLQRHPEALLRELRWRPAMRDEFNRLLSLPDRAFTDIERAARFLYLQALAYGGKVQGRNFGVDPTQPHVFDLRRLTPRIERLHDRMAGVAIENLGWRDCIKRYDRPGTLFYLDPPYWGSETDYGEGLFSRADFVDLSEDLRACQGRVLLSINDVPDMRELLAWADVLEVETRYFIAGSSGEGGAPAGELLVGKGVDLRAIVAGRQAALL